MARHDRSGESLALGETPKNPKRSKQMFWINHHQESAVRTTMDAEMEAAKRLQIASHSFFWRGECERYSPGCKIYNRSPGFKKRQFRDLTLIKAVGSRLIRIY